MSHCNFSAREQALLQPCLFLLSLAVNIATRSFLQFLVGFRETVIGKLPSYFQAGEGTAFCSHLLRMAGLWQRELLTPAGKVLIHLHVAVRVPSRPPPQRTCSLRSVCTSDILFSYFNEMNSFCTRLSSLIWKAPCLECDLTFFVLLRLKVDPAAFPSYQRCVHLHSCCCVRPFISAS